MPCEACPVGGLRDVILYVVRDTGYARAAAASGPKGLPPCVYDKVKDARECE